MNVLHWFRRRTSSPRETPLSGWDSSKIKSETRALIHIANELERLLDSTRVVDSGSVEPGAANILRRKLEQAENRLMLTIADIAKERTSARSLELSAVSSVFEETVFVSPLARTALQRVFAREGSV